MDGQLKRNRFVQRRNDRGNPARKDPDRVSFWTDGQLARCSSEDTGPTLGAKEISSSLIVEDYKMNGKFQSRMLRDIVEKKPNTSSWVEGQKVMNQIHDYLDMHGNRYGYIITETELVMVRRRDEERSSRWGQMD
jgi:hypothetical protein